MSDDGVRPAARRGKMDPGFIESVRTWCDWIESKSEANFSTPIRIGVDMTY